MPQKHRRVLMNMSSCRNSWYCQVRHISTVSFQLNQELNTDLHQTIIQGDNQSCQYFAWHKNTEVQLRSAGRIQYLQRTQLFFFFFFLKNRMQVKGFSLSQGMTGSTKPQQQNWFNQCGPPPSVQTQSERLLTASSHAVNYGAVRSFVGHILKWWTWRRRLSGAGCLPCCSCEGQSKPG